MSTANPITTPSIPTPNGDTKSLQQAVMAIKQNIEIAQGTRGIVRASQIHGPTAVNTELGAAISAVKATLP